MNGKVNQEPDQTGIIKEFFNRCAPTWDDSCRQDSQKMNAIVSLAGVGTGSRVADVACGTGVLFPEILSRKPELLLGIDLSDGMIQKARSKFSSPRLRLVASDLFDVRESGFDTVILYNAYPHFPDKIRLARHLAAMLKPGGKFVVAHGEGKDAINSHHRGPAVSRISWELRPVGEEAAKFTDDFKIDRMVDTDSLYLFSGVKLS